MVDLCMRVHVHMTISPVKTGANKAARQLVDCLDSKLFAALAEPNRVELIKILLLHGPSDVGSIADKVPQDRSVISRHLKVLLEAGVVSCEKDGQRRVYRMNGGALLESFEGIVKQAKQTLPLCCPIKKARSE